MAAFRKARLGSRAGFVHVIVVAIIAAIALGSRLSGRDFVLPEPPALPQPLALVDRQPPIPPGLARPEEILPFDILTIVVEGEPDLTHEYQVDSEGRIAVPLIGIIQAAGLTAAQFTDRLTAALADGYMMRPRASVAVAESTYQTVFVLGEVGSPGAVTIPGPISVMAALAHAGVPKLAADSELVVVRPKTPRATRPTPLADPDATITSVRTNHRDGGGAGQLDLEDGDTVYVLKAQSY